METATIAKQLGIEIGTIFESSWGYDQTNVDFYEVVGTTAKRIKVRKIAKKIVLDNGGPTVFVEPRPGVFVGEPMTKKILEAWGPGFTVSTYAFAGLWDGKSVSQTGGGWGH